MRAECPDQSRCLHLVASAGQSMHGQEDWSRLTGAFRRIPLNVRKVGLVGGSGTPILIESNIVASHWLADPGWARREGIVSFAGQPLIFRGEILGVLAVFSRAEISQSQFGWLRTFAHHAAVAIANARAFEELARLRHLLELERDHLRHEVREALAFGEIVGESRALQTVLRQIDGGADGRDRACPRRIRHRQGVDSVRHSRPERTAPTAPCQGELCIHPR